MFHQTVFLDPHTGLGYYQKIIDAIAEKILRK
jgi:hypothetical protein